MVLIKDEILSNQGSGDSESSGINIKADLAPVLSATPTGIKYVFNLLFGKKHVETERMLKLADAQNTVDVKKILSGEAFYDHSKQQLVEPLGVTNSLLLIAEKIKIDEVSNLIDCSVQAAAYIDGEQSTEAPEELDDFINRWKNEAKLISSEAAQAIWGRVLAQEVNSPGSISLRTMDVIRNISKAEASNFNDICKYVVFDRLVVDNQQGNPISNQVFSSVRDAGLIADFTPGMYRGAKWSKTNLAISGTDEQSVYFVQYGDFFVFADEAELNAAGLEIPSYCYWELTMAGRELYKVVRETMKIEVLDVAKVLTKKDDLLIQYVKCYRYVSVDKNEVDASQIVSIL